MSALDAAIATAWNDALVAEQRAVFGYSVLGPHLDNDLVALARNCQSDHDGRQRATVDAISAAGGTPAASAPDYPDLYTVRDSPTAQALAITLEQAAAAAWRYLYAVAASAPSAPAGLRAQAQSGLTAAAVNATRWRRHGAGTPTVAFPGI